MTKPNPTPANAGVVLRMALTRGCSTLIDGDDLLRVAAYRWVANGDLANGYPYAVTNLPGRGRVLYLHRFLMAAPTGMVVDHLNHDTLDNRKSNLMLCTQAENVARRRGPQSNNRSGVLNVRRCESGRFSAEFTRNHATTYLGRFDTIEQATAALERAK